MSRVGQPHHESTRLVVLFAPEHERDLVDANIAIAQEAAEETFEVMERIGAELPTSGFTAAITDDQDRFDLWSGGLEELVNFEVAGFAESTERPSRRTEFMPADIATGPYTSGSWIGMGPKSADRRKAVFIHEYAHALHESALPYGLLKTWSIDTVEGFAQYVEELATGEGSCTMDPRAKDNIAVHEGWTMADDRLRRPDAYLGYWAASSYFHFVEAAGGSPWQLAMDRDEGLTMPQRAMRQGPEFNEQAWLDWVALQ